MISLVSLLKNILSDDAVYRFINNVAEESKCCGEIMKKELVK